MFPPGDKIPTIKRKKSIKIKDKVMAFFSREQTDDLTSLFPLPPTPTRPRTAPAPHSQSQWKAAEGEEISDEEMSSERSTNSLRSLSLSPSQSKERLCELPGDETFPDQPPPPPPSPHLHADAQACSDSPTTPNSRRSRETIEEESVIRLSDRKVQDSPGGYQRLDFLSESYQRLDLSNDVGTAKSATEGADTPSRPARVDLSLDTARLDQFPLSHASIDKMLAQITTPRRPASKSYSRPPPTPAPTRPLPPLPQAGTGQRLSLYPPRDSRVRRGSSTISPPDDQGRKDSAASLSLQEPEKPRKDSLPLPPTPPSTQGQRLLPSPPLTPRDEQVNASVQLAEQLQKAFQQWAEQVEKAPSFEVTLKINSNAM